MEKLKRNELQNSLLNSHWFFSSLTIEEKDLIFQDISIISYKKRETIIKQGEYISNFIFLLKGFVKTEVQNVNKSMILSILPSLNIITAPSCLTEDKYSYSITSLSDSEVLFINIHIVRKILSLNNKLLFNTLKYSNEKYFDPIIEKLKNISQNNLRGRLANLLLELSTIHNSNKFMLLLNRSEIARMICFSRENVIKILSELNREKVIIINGKTIEIINPEKLIDMAKYC